MADNLGEYKVVVSADYSNLQKSIADLLKSIQGSADDISGVFSKMTDSIEKSAVSSKAFDSVKGSIDEGKDRQTIILLMKVLSQITMVESLDQLIGMSLPRNNNMHGKNASWIISWLNLAWPVAC